MELQSLVQYKKSKRRERAARMATEASEPVGILDDLDSAEEDTDLLKLKPPRPPRPKKVKETLKEPLYEEDIIEGFSFCSFKTYDDLEKMAKWSSQHNGKYPDPYSKLKLDEEKKMKKKKKKKDKNRDRDSILSQIDPNTIKGSSGSSSEKGYICDSDSDGDKGSDTGVGDLFRARKLSNVCQNGLSPGGAVNADGSGLALPAVPLPESVARSYNVTSQPLGGSGQPAAAAAVTTAPTAAAAAAPAPKPLYRPFAISPPPSTKATTAAVTPTTATPPFISSTLSHPAYRTLHNPFFPTTLGSYNPFYPSSVSSAATPPYNGLLFPPPGVPPRTTTPTLGTTHTVASSHYDLTTCKSHLPKLAHALTTTSPRGAVTPNTTPLAPPTPKSSYPSLPLNDPANLRRELDNRFLHDRNLAATGTLRPPTYLGGADPLNPLATPIHRPPSNQSPAFLASSLGKEHPKMGGPNSLFAGLGTPPGFPGISPLGAVDPLRSSSVTTSLNSPLITSASSGGTSSTPQLPTASSTSSTSAATPLPKKTGKWNAMHVRIAWEIYNHQQKQKGDSSKKPGDNPLVPSTPTSSLSKAAPNQASTKSSSSDLLASSSAHKRPAPGAPPRTDFMHKRQATDADILQSQLFAPPRPPPPPNPLDPLSNPLLARPPYMSPFGPSPLQSALSPYPRFGSSGAPFGGLGSLRDSALNASHLNYPGLVSSASPSELFAGLPRPTVGFPGTPSSSLFSSPSTTTVSSWHATNSLKDSLKVPKLPPPASPSTLKDKSPHIKHPMESPGRNNTGSNGSAVKTNGSSIGRPISASSISPIVNPSLDLSLKKEDHEITVVGEKVNVPNGRPTSVTPLDRPPSSRSATPKHTKTSDTRPYSRPPGGSSMHPGHAPPVSLAQAMNPFGLPGLYPPPGLPPSPFGLDPFRDPYRAAAALANPYLQSRETMLRLNQLMMTEQERIRMGLTGYPTPAATHAPALFPPPHVPPGAASAGTPSSLLSKPPHVPHPPGLGYPPGYGLGLPPLPSSATPPTLNGHTSSSAGASGSTYHAK